MLSSEKVAIAAHLHVLLRRKTGRVTDTEWMAGNAEYAREIIRFARRSAREDGHEDLAQWAAKLEAALFPAQAAARAAAPAPGLPTPQPGQPAARVSAPAPLHAEPVAERSSGFGHSMFGESGFLESTFSGEGLRRDPDAPRYVGGLR